MNKREDIVRDYEYFLDDSMMPSAEESKKIVIPEELRKRMSERIDKELRELGYY